MLASKLPDGSSNFLLQDLGSGAVDALVDLMFHVKGPRLRDKISHGEAPSLPYEVARDVFALIRAVGDSSLDDYRSVFHPVALAEFELEQTLSALLQWNTDVSQVGF